MTPIFPSLPSSEHKYESEKENTDNFDLRSSLVANIAASIIGSGILAIWCAIKSTPFLPFTLRILGPIVVGGLANIIVEKLAQDKIISLGTKCILKTLINLAVVISILALSIIFAGSSPIWYGLAIGFITIAALSEVFGKDIPLFEYEKSL